MVELRALQTDINSRRSVWKKGEKLILGSIYNFTVNYGAVAGGGGQDPSGSGYDPLDSRTAWLHSQFLDETLSDYDSSGWARFYDAGRLQKAIWALEQEITMHELGSNSFYNLADNSGATGIGDVVVLNLYSNDGRHKDVLARVTPVVPAPGALLLSGLGTMVAGYLRKRRTL